MTPTVPKRTATKKQAATRRPPRPERTVIANWKMNPATVGKAKELFVALRKAAGRRPRVETVVAPPHVYLAELRKLTTGTHTKLGAQDVSGETGGTHTGDVSVSMLKSVGVSHVIVGHSERRAKGEDDEAVARKVAAATGGGLVAVLCVGERTRDAAGQYLTAVEHQLRRALGSLPKAALGRVIVAYEPVWAISTGDGRGRPATPDDIHEMSLFITKTLTDMFDRSSAARVPVLYGGSVNETNAASFIADTAVSGFLVGGASLDPDAFSAIVTAAHRTG